MTTLIIPDLHTDLPFAERILEREHGRFEDLVFLGDYFDSYHPVCSAKRICAFLLDVRARYDTTFLVGNHDLQYFALAPELRRSRRVLSQDALLANPYICSGFSRQTADAVGRYLDSSFFLSCKVAVMRQRYLLSHAGVMPHLLPYHPGGDDAQLDAFFRQADVAVRTTMSDRTNPIWAAGRARNGQADVGGALWCDFNDEFEDLLPWPQIVGHTQEGGVKWKGRSVCIDAAQTAYATLTNGHLEVHYT